MSFDAGTIIATADLDRDPFNAGLDLAKADGEAFAAKTYTAKLATDSSNADAGVATENAALDDFGRKTATATLKANDADADAKIAATDAAADALGRKSETITLKADTSGVDSGLSRVGAESAAAAGSGGVGGLVTALAAVGPAIVPIGAVAAAGIGGIAAMAASAGLGLGAFGLAAAGDFKQVENAASETLSAFQKLAAPEVLPVISKSISLIGPAFAALAPFVDSTAQELGKLENAAQTAFTAPFWRGFVTFLASEAGPAIGSFSTLAGGMLKAFAGLSVGLAPIIGDIEGGLDGIGNRLSTFGETVGTSSGFQSFVSYVEKEAPVVGQLLSNLGGDFTGFVTDLAPLGAAILPVLSGLTEFVKELEGIHGPFGTNLIDLGLGAYAFSKLAGMASTAALGLKTFGAAVTDKAAFGAVAGGSSMLENMAAGLGGVGAAATIAAPLIAAVGFAFWQSGNQAAVGEAQAKAFLDGVNTEAASTLPQITAKLADLKAKLDALIPAYNSGKIGFDALVDASSALKTSIASTEAEQTNYKTNLDTLTGQLGLSKSQVEALAKSINIDLGTSLNPAQVRQFSGALQEQATQAGLSAAALKSMAESDGQSFNAIISAGNAAASSMTTTWASYGNAVTAFASSTVPVAAKDIANFYGEQELQGAAFTANIQKAIKDGYSPVLISQILQAGPAQASNLLQGMVNAQGTGLSSMITGAMAAMSKEGVEAVQEARLTAEAVAAKSSDMTAQLGTALSISQALTTSNVEASVAAVASHLSGGIDSVIHIAGEYGIALPNGLTASIKDAGVAAAAQAAGVTSALGQGIPGATSVANSLAAVVPDAITHSLPAVAAAGTQTAGSFVAVLHAHLTDASTAGANLATSVGSGIGGVNLSPAGAASLHQIISGLTESGGFLTPKGQAAALANAAAATIAGFAGQFDTAGLNLAKGVAAGLTAGIGVVSVAAEDVLNQVLAATNAKAGIKSPSTLFAEKVGLPIVQGIAMGMRSGDANQALGQAAATIITSALAGLTDAGQIHSPSALTSTAIGVPIAQGIAAGISSPTSTDALTTAATGAVSAVAAGLTAGTPDAVTAADAIVAAALGEITNADSQFQSAGAGNAAAYAAGLTGSVGAAGSGTAAPTSTDPQTLASELAQAYAGIAQQAGGASSATGAYGNQPVSAQLAQLQAAAQAVTQTQTQLATALAGQKAQNAQDATDAAGGPETAADVLVDQQVTQMVAQAQDQAAKAMQSFTAVGAAISQGISAGLNGATGAPIDAAQTLINNLIAAMQAAAQISSPSQRAAREIGVPIAQGIVAGLASEAGNTSAAASRVIDGIFGHLPTGPNHGGPVGSYSPIYHYHFEISGNVDQRAIDQIAKVVHQIHDQRDQDEMAEMRAGG